MPSLKTIFAGILLSLCLWSPAKAAQPPLRFPQVTAYSLAKSKVTLPTELAAPYDLLLLTFEPDQNAHLQIWIDMAQNLQHLNPNLRYYVLPVSNREIQLFRWWQNSSVRSAFSDPELWPWIVPLYVDRPRFEHDLNITDTHTVVALLTDRNGNVLWRVQGGNPTAARMQIERLLPH